VIEDSPGIGDIAVARDGSVYVLDATNDRVQVFEPEGRHNHTFGNFGTGEGQFAAPAEITLGPDGSVFVLDSDRVTKFSADGKFVWRSPDPATDEDLFLLHGIAVRADGDVLLTCEACPNSIMVLDGENGTVTERWDEPMLHGAQMTIDSAGRIYAEDWGTATLYLLAPDGTVLGVKALGPNDELTGLERNTNRGDSFWPVPVPMPNDRAFTFNELGLVELSVAVP
jgi:DNA-binding beta-propeller fold protein YncE